MQSIRHFMVDSGWRQADLAAALGINYSYVSLLLAGKRRPSLKVIEKMAEVTRIPVGTLVEESGKPPPRKMKLNGKPKRIPSTRIG